MAYNKNTGFRGNRRASTGGTYQGKPARTETWDNGRRDTYYGGSGGALGKNHGHRITTSNGFPIYDRKPGNKKRQQKSSYSLGDILFGKPKKGKWL